jgi:hypothetical protein
LSPEENNQAESAESPDDPVPNADDNSNNEGDK